MQQEERHLLVAAWLGDRLVVLKHENNRRGKRCQLVEQDRKHGSGDIGVLDPELPGILPGGQLGAGFLQRTHEVPPQPARVILAVI
ncbi:MAG: hypothetical protein ACRDNT_10885 [Streptosporangiaceae bacterium]